MPFGSQFEDAVAGRFSNLFQAINDAAEQGFKALMPQIFEQLGRLCVAAGTSMDAPNDNHSPGSCYFSLSTDALLILNVLILGLVLHTFRLGLDLLPRTDRLRKAP